MTEINWEIHPTKIGCLYSKTTKNNNTFHLTICDTYVNVESTSSEVEVSVVSINDAKKIAMKLVNFLSTIQ